MSRSLAATIAFSLTIVLMMSGCQSDPYCQTAISNLRAEKIQLENQYYTLKSQYESDMARLGEPIQDFSLPLAPPIIEGEIIDGGIVYSRADGNLLDRVIAESGGPLSVRANRRTPTLTSHSGPGEMSSHIRRIEVDQLRASANDLTRLLIRPLDDRGDIIPVAGDIKIRLVDSSSRSTVYENEFTRAQVDEWIKDHPGQQPGIHLRIPLPAQPSLSSHLVCELQFRTSDNRILKKSASLVFPATKTTAGGLTIGPAPRRSRNASTPLLTDDLGGQINIEIGDELNFDSLDSGNSPPQWQPDR